VIKQGDFNGDLNRTTPMVRFVNGHMGKYEISSLCQYYDVDYGYQSATTQDSKSKFDRFNYYAKMLESYINVHNTSDYSVIYVKFRSNTSVRHLS